MPSASVAITVSASPLTLASDRSANLMSVMMSLRGIGGALQRGSVQPVHLHQRLHAPPLLLLVRIREQLRENLRHDLPRHAVLVLEPAAAPVRSAGAQFPPQL